MKQMHKICSRDIYLFSIIFILHISFNLKLKLHFIKYYQVLFILCVGNGVTDSHNKKKMLEIILTVFKTMNLFSSMIFFHWQCYKLLYHKMCMFTVVPNPTKYCFSFLFKFYITFFIELYILIL